MCKRFSFSFSCWGVCAAAATAAALVLDRVVPPALNIVRLIVASKVLELHNKRVHVAKEVQPRCELQGEEALFTSKRLEVVGGGGEAFCVLLNPREHIQ